MRCYIFDLDGTVCDIEHRLHFVKKPEVVATCDVLIYDPAPPWKADWDSFYAACVGDKPIEPICSLLRDLGREAPIVFVSGRSEVVREHTIRWLRTYALSPSLVVEGIKLYMRADRDHRPDHVVKSEMLDSLLADGYEPIMAFDDRKQVVDMWRARGVLCAQVAEGNF